MPRGTRFTEKKVYLCRCKRRRNDSGRPVTENCRMMKKTLTALLITLASAAGAGAKTPAGETAGTHTHYSEWLVASEMKRTPHPYNLDFSSTPRWSYVMGIELESMLDTYLEYGGDDIEAYLKEYPAKMIDDKGDITKYKYSDFNLDNVRTGRFILRMYGLFPSEKDSLALCTLFRQLENQPRTQEGVWWHKAIYANQVWLDGIFMGLPFYCMAAPWLRPDNVTDYYDDATDQITKTEARTYDAATGLWKHAWDETHTMFWADKTTGLSRHTWARALGWFSMAMVEVLDVLPADYDGRAGIEDMFRKVMTAVVRYQDGTSGVWYDVMDVDNPRNYLEATASSMFTYCLLKGHRLGYLDDSFLEAGIKGYRGIVGEFVRENGDGTISLTKCCEVSGLGPDNNRRRDGSFEYYISEPVRDNDAKGIGPFVWASLEMERMGFTVQNLYTRDTGIAPVSERERPDGRAYDLRGIARGDRRGGLTVTAGRKTIGRQVLK